MRYLAMGLDVALVWLCALLAYLFLGFVKASSFGIFGFLPPFYGGVTMVGILLLLLFSGRVYQSWRITGLGHLLATITLAWLVTVMALLAWLFFSKTSTDISRAWFLLWAGSALVAMGLARVVVYWALRWLRKLGYSFKTVLLVCEDDACQTVEQALADAPWSGLLVRGVVTPAALQTALAAPNAQQPQEVWLCLAMGDKAGIETSLHALRHSTANIRLVPDWFSLKLMNHGVSVVAGMPMLDLSASPITGSMRLFKALEDRIGALIILTVVAVPMLAIAAAIKLTSRGPVLYKQVRHGWNGHPILVYKFRSMVVHDEANFQVTQACKNDDRITPLGAFLRRTSLDELPQFINVLQGRMSIVGPRPHAVQHNEYYKELVPGYMLRHKVKPGVTGWAQINGFRGETNTLDKMQQRIDYDLYYIENMSIWFDLKIIFKTMYKGWTHKNAY